MSDFYFGYYLQCEGKDIQVVDEHVCAEHGAFGSSAIFCPQCGEELGEQTTSEIFTFFSSSDGIFDGPLATKDITTLQRNFDCIIDACGEDFLVPSKSKMWGMNMDRNREMKPPKIPTITETRAKLKEDIKFLKKFYRKVTLKFGIVDMW